MLVRFLKIRPPAKVGIFIKKGSSEMKQLARMFFILIALVFIGVNSAKADTYVNGYYRKNGTYVSSHYRSDANGTTSDNWSTRGNTNPYTGEAGTKSYDNYNNSGYNSNYNNSYNSQYRQPSYRNGGYYH